jgi:hypothetical protein
MPNLTKEQRSAGVLTKRDESLNAYLEEIEDPDVAIDVANRLLTDVKDPADIVSRVRQGRKRHPGYGLSKIRPLEGASVKMSNKIRVIVGLRYGGFSDVSIEKTMGWSHNNINKIEIKYPSAFQQAREELVKAAVIEYQTNVAFTRAALSESGFKAVETLTEVMDTPDAKISERLRAAETVLKLVAADKTQSPGEVAGEIISSFGDALAGIAKAQRQGDYIENVEDAEVIDVEID